MQIAVHSSSTKTVPTGLHFFLQQLWQYTALQHTTDEFILLGNFNALQPKSHVQHLPLQNTNTHSLYFKEWQLPSLLKKHNAAVLVQCSDSISFTTKQPQIILITTLSKLNYFLRIRLQKAASIIAFSAYHQKAIATAYQLPLTAINVVPLAVAGFFVPIDDYTVTLTTKQQYAQGNEYFLLMAHEVNEAQVIDMLKAFSQFKRLQKSTTYLLIAGNVSYSKNFTEKLASYKYRQHVLILPNQTEEQIVTLMGAAYAVIIAGIGFTSQLALLQAMKTQMAIIAMQHEVHEEMALDNVLYYAHEQMEALADVMKQLYKDENLRSKLAYKALNRATHYSLEKSSSLLMQAIYSASTK